MSNEERLNKLIVKGPTYEEARESILSELEFNISLSDFKSNFEQEFRDNLTTKDDYIQSSGVYDTHSYEVEYSEASERRDELKDMENSYFETYSEEEREGLSLYDHIEEKYGDDRYEYWDELESLEEKLEVMDEIEQGYLAYLNNSMEMEWELYQTFNDIDIRKEMIRMAEDIIENLQTQVEKSHSNLEHFKLEIDSSEYDLGYVKLHEAVQEGNITVKARSNPYAKHEVEGRYNVNHEDLAQLMESVDVEVVNLWMERIQREVGGSIVPAVGDKGPEQLIHSERKVDEVVLDTINANVLKVRLLDNTKELDQFTVDALLSEDLSIEGLTLQTLSKAESRASDLRELKGALEELADGAFFNIDSHKEIKSFEEYLINSASTDNLSSKQRMAVRESLVNLVTLKEKGNKEVDKSIGVLSHLDEKARDIIKEKTKDKSIKLVSEVDNKQKSKNIDLEM